MSKIDFFDRLELPKKAVYSVARDVTFKLRNCIMSPGLKAHDYDHYRSDSLEDLIEKIKETKALEFDDNREYVFIKVYPVEDESVKYFDLDPTDATPWKPRELKTTLSHHATGKYYDMVDKRYECNNYIRIIMFDGSLTRVLYEYFSININSLNGEWGISAMFSYDMMYDPDCHPSTIKFGLPVGLNKAIPMSRHGYGYLTEYGYFDKDGMYRLTECQNAGIIAPLYIYEPKGTRYLQYIYGAIIVYPTANHFHVYAKGYGVGCPITVDSIKKVEFRPIVEGLTRYLVKPKTTIGSIVIDEPDMYCDAFDTDTVKNNVTNFMKMKYDVFDIKVDMEMYRVPDGIWFMNEYNDKYLVRT